MKTLALIAPCVLGISTLAAQPLFTGSEASLSTGVYGNSCKSPFTFLYNTASLADGEASAGLYASNRYMLKELAVYTATATLPVAAGGMGLAMQYTGTSAAYHEMQWALAYGQSLGRVQIGAGAGYSIIRVPGYDSYGALAWAIGTVWRVTPQFRSGMQVVNSAGSRHGRNPSEKQPIALQVGAGYEWSEQLLLSGMITKEANSPVRVQLSLQYLIQKYFLAGMGVIADIASPWFSLGWQWKHVEAMVTAAFHPQLGPTPGLTVVFRSEKDADKK